MASLAAQCVLVPECGVGYRGGWFWICIAVVDDQSRLVKDSIEERDEAFSGVANACLNPTLTALPV